MAKRLTQTALAQLVGVSKTQIGRVLRALQWEGGLVSDPYAMRVLVVADLVGRHDFTSTTAIALLNEFGAEVDRICDDPAERCWILFVETGVASFRLPVSTDRQLVSLLDANRLCLVLSLHELFAGAADRLAGWKAAKLDKAPA